MTTLFISDLHLDDKCQGTTALLQKFLQTEVVRADALYILGDLFEFWLGDDVVSPCAQQVAMSLSSLADQGVPCYFMHGNRDFLVGNDYASSAGLTLLPQEHVIDLYGERVLLIHGDSLCTDDVAYQEFRSMVRNVAWQKDFLAMPPQQRLNIALQARDASAEHKGKSGTRIMDVNPAEVSKIIAKHNVLRMIHGHTHRPATHQLHVNGHKAERIVLGDWHVKGSVLRVKPGSFELSVIS